MMREIFCLLGITLMLGGCAQYSTVKKRPISAVTVTAEQKVLAGSLKSFSGQPLVRLGLLLDAADAARLQLAANPSNTLARSDYNFAVARIMEIIGEEGLAPWDAPVSCRSGAGDEWRLRFKPLDLRPEFHPSKFHIMPVDRYDFHGELVGERVIKQGLGAPMVVTGKDQNFTEIDQFAQGEQIFYGMTAVLRFDGRQGEIVLIDPLDEETVRFDERDYPLTGDFQAPLALALAELNQRKQELAELFKPDQFYDSARLARLQPYDPDKIPVLCIHGLGNSQATWMPLIDFLRGDETIRQDYQFWFFSYPSGLPYPMSAANLRDQLDQLAQRYPDHKDIVVIGHSMGGMISRLLITDSGMTLWDAIYDKPPAEMPFHEDTRSVMSDMLIFSARPEISRVIYASASHRGSEDAASLMGQLGAAIIGNPMPDGHINEEDIAYVRPDIESSKSIACRTVLTC
jgi:hypothetical protein